MSADSSDARGFEPLVVGRLSGSYGVHGWLKVHSFTEPMANLLEYRQLYVQHAGSWQPLNVEAGKVHGKGLILKLEGVDTPEQARTFSSCDVAVDSAVLPPLSPGDYYWHQLTGLAVHAEHEGAAPVLLGEVDHLLETGANDVLVVRPCIGSIDQRERLVPYLPETVVKRVDLQQQMLVVDWDPDF